MEPTQQPLAFDTQGNLIIPGVHSDNYVTGVSGWSINKDGSAEFNNVVIRNGTVVSGTNLYYSGTPAFGNLVGSISSAAGTDSFGNGYLAGFTVYDPGINFTQMHSGFILVGQIIGGVPDTSQASEIIISGSALDILGPTDTANGFPIRSLIEVVSGTNGVLVPGSTEPFVRLVSNGSSVASMTLTGAVTKATSLGNPYAWQTPTYSTNWSGSTTFNGVTGEQTLRFRPDAEDNVIVQGVFKAGAVAPVNPVFMLPTAFIPKQRAKLVALRNNGGVVTAGMIDVTTAGNFNVSAAFGLGIAANNEYVVTGSYPLGNLS